MTDKEKQIDELAIAIYETLKKINGIAFMVYSKDDYYHKCARELYSMGYRKQSEVAENIIEMLKAARPVVKVHFEAYDELIENIAAEYGVEVEK